MESDEKPVSRQSRRKVAQEAADKYPLVAAGVEPPDRHRPKPPARQVSLEGGEVVHVEGEWHVTRTLLLTMEHFALRVSEGTLRKIRELKTLSERKEKLLARVRPVPAVETIFPGMKKSEADKLIASALTWPLEDTGRGLAPGDEGGSR